MPAPNTFSASSYSSKDLHICMIACGLLMTEQTKRTMKLSFADVLSLVEALQFALEEEVFDTSLGWNDHLDLDQIASMARIFDELAEGSRQLIQKNRDFRSALERLNREEEKRMRTISSMDASRPSASAQARHKKRTGRRR